MFRYKLLWLLILLFTFVPLLLAGNRVGSPSQSARQVVRQARYIFAGTVTAIQRTKGGASAVDSVQITFHVDRAVRGVQTGQSLTIREWSGLWASGDRYHVGQQVVLCLYKPSKLGLTSPVGGAMGEVIVDRRGEVLPQPEWQAAKSAWKPGTQTRQSVEQFTRILRRSAEE
jgi:hypothetical protein